MQVIDGSVVYSATDLVGYLACDHLTSLERAAAARLIQRPMTKDAELDRIAQRGLEHERRFLDTLRAEGRSVASIALDGSATDVAAELQQATADTLEAMRSGVDVVYQATFFDGSRRGHADFLRRVEEPSNLGAWSYEVWDTKLARHAKGSAVLQLCFYSDMLEAALGRAPERMYLALGGGARETVSFRFAEYAAYYRLVHRGFLDFMALPLPQLPLPMPEVVEHCEICRWSLVCSDVRRKADDLSLVAGIEARQRRDLRERGVPTRTALAAFEVASADPPWKRAQQRGYTRVREQARIQVEGERADRTLHERLEPGRTREDALDPLHGLVSLPAPSRGDLFFDIEGDPFALDDGIDYLFGVIEPGRPRPDGTPTFHAFWAVEDGDVTTAAEQRAFEALIDLIMDRRAADPDLHVYHYAPYEPTAMKRLMGRYGTREAEVDTLLRAGVFVDLYRVVRQGIRASVESYSIKKLEPLYGLKRDIELKDANSSIVAFETWLELGGDEGDRQKLLDDIEAYNKDDCVSTWRLRDWLESQRLALADDLGVTIPRPLPPDHEAVQALTDRQAAAADLMQRLAGDVPQAEAQRTPEQQARWLLSQLVPWHAREDKSAWWEFYHLKEDFTDEERAFDTEDALGLLEPLGQVGTVKQSIIYGFHYPAQDHPFKTGDAAYDPAEEKLSRVDVHSLDEQARVITFTRGKNRPAPEFRSLIPLDYIPNHGLRDSIARVAESVIAHGIDGDGPYRAARDLLLHVPPRLGQTDGADLVALGEDVQAAARRLVLRLDETTLAIQGPPGSGKSTVGAQMIADLVAAGQQVGVMASSHKVIGQLLERAHAFAAREGRSLRIVQAARAGEGVDVATQLGAGEVRGALDGGAEIAGGTVWLWSREDMIDAVDVLFIDEAGQFALANAIAAAPATKSFVLLGDPQQLNQVLKGTHPPGAERSVLGHVLNGRATMPPDRGLFLGGTYRLHPAITEYTSEVFYEGRLQSAPERERHAVNAETELAGSGLRFLDVPHEEGRDSESPEEAGRIARLVRDLFDHEATWTDHRGERHVLTTDDVLIITPYNAQVRAVSEALAKAGVPQVRVGTVDKFQGQEAPVSIYSMATSDAEHAPRGMEFLYSLNRLNVATSRAKAVAAVVANGRLLRVRCKTPRQMQLANALARLFERAT